MQRMRANEDDDIHVLLQIRIAREQTYIIDHNVVDKLVLPDLEMQCACTC